MEHTIEYITLFGSTAMWVCQKCQQGPFTPVVVVTGEVHKDFRVVSKVMSLKKAQLHKARLNLMYNRAIYRLMHYGDLLIIRGYGEKVIPFVHEIRCSSRGFHS